MSNWSRTKVDLFGASLRHAALCAFALGLCIAGGLLLSAPRQDVLAERVSRAGRIASTELAEPLQSRSTDLNARTRALLVRRDVGFAWLRVRDANGHAVAAAGRLEPAGRGATSKFGRDLRRSAYALISTEHRQMLVFEQREVGSLEFGLLIGAASVGAASGQLLFGLLALLIGIPALFFQSSKLFQSLRPIRVPSYDEPVPVIATMTPRLGRRLAEISTEAARAAPVLTPAVNEVLSAFKRGGIVVDREQLICEMNPLAEHLSGWLLAQARHRPLKEIFQLFNADLQRSVTLPLVECLSGTLDRSGNNYFLRNRDGNVLEIELTLAPVREAAGPITGVLITVNEVAKKPDLLQRITSTVAAPIQDPPGLSRVLTDQLLENVITTDSQDRIQFANDRALATFGYSLVDIRGEPIGKLLPQPFMHLSRARVSDYALVLPQTPAARAVARRRDGSKFDVSLEVHPVGSGQHTGFLITVRPAATAQEPKPDMKAENRVERLAEVARVVADAIQPGNSKSSGPHTFLADTAQSDAKLDFFAYHDALTGLPSRSLFMNRLEHVLTSADAGRSGFAVVHLALSAFADINQRYGSDVGDRLLKTVADRLSAGVGPADTVARVEDAEFLLLLQGSSRREEVTTTLKRIQSTIAQTFRAGTHPLEIDASFGATVYPEDKSSPELLLQHASLALQEAQAKSLRRGKGQIQVYRENFATRQLPSDEFAARLKAAQTQGQLEIEFQAITNVRSRQIVGVEVLLSWRQDGGVLRTAAALKHAGLSDAFIAALSEWVIEGACAHYGNLHNLELPELPLLFNATALPITGRAVLHKLRGVLAKYRVPAKQLIFMINADELEALMLRPDSWIPLARDLGLRIGISDVTIEQLDLLRRADVDVVWLSPSVTAGLLTSEQATQRVKAIIHAGQRVGAQIFSSGIERAEQRETLLELGCYLQQGSLLGEVMRPRKFFRLLARAEVGAI